MSDEDTVPQRQKRDYRFTDMISLAFESFDGETVVIDLYAPLFVWLYLGDFELKAGQTADFYLDTEDVLPGVRGVIETACEKAWELFMEVVHHHGPGPYQDVMLPQCHMRWGTITTTTTRLRDMSAHLVTVGGYVQHKELTLVHEGFERLLKEMDDARSGS